MAVLGVLSSSCKRDNTVYKPVNADILYLELYDLSARVEQYDQGVMTPIDGKFTALICRRAGKKDYQRARVIETPDSTIVNGVIKTARFGNIQITLHGQRGYGLSGLYDGTITNPEYYLTGMKQQFYMTDYQLDKILDFLKEKAE